MFENIRLSFRGIWAHKMRSFLTMLGIIIGIAAIIAIVSTIKGTNEQIKQNLVGAGENTVEISLYQGEWEYEMEYNGIPEGVPLVADEVVEQLKEIPHVENVSRYLSRQDYNGVPQMPHPMAALLLGQAALRQVARSEVRSHRLPSRPPA